MPKLKIYLEKEGKTKQIEAVTIEEILKKLSLNPTVYLVSVNDELVIGNYKPKPKDKIKIMPVISGG